MTGHIKFDWSKLPTEAEMQPQDFGTKQVYLFLKKMSEDLLKGKIHIRHEEDGTICVGDDRVYGSLLDKGKWKHAYRKWNGGEQAIVIETYDDPFALFQAVLIRCLKSHAMTWEMLNYACVA